MPFYGNSFLATAVGSARLDADGEQSSFRFSPLSNATVANLYFYAQDKAGESLYWLTGLRSDDNGTPASTWLGSKAVQITASGWKEAVLSSPVVLAGTGTYHMIVGTVVSGTSVLSDWWDANWGTRKKISSGNHEIYSTIHYLKVPLDSDIVTGGLSNGSDVRVVLWTSGSQYELGRYLSVNAGTLASDNYIFFKISDGQPGGTIPLNEDIGAQSDYIYYVYYGNAGAGAPPAYVNTDCIDAPYTTDANTVALYHFGEISGSYIDTAGLNPILSGSINGVTRTGDNSWGGNCPVFDGVNDQLKIGTGADSIKYPTKTIEAWFWTNNNYTGNGDVFDNNKYGIVRFEADDWIHVYAFDTAFKTIGGSVALNDGAWHHVGFIAMGGTKIELWVDGVNKGSKAFGAQGGDSFWPSIGAFNDTPPTREFTGTIREVRVSNATRSSFYHISTELVATKSAAQTASSGTTTGTPSAGSYISVGFRTPRGTFWSYNGGIDLTQQVFLRNTSGSWLGQNATPIFAIGTSGAWLGNPYDTFTNQNIASGTEIAQWLNWDVSGSVATFSQIGFHAGRGASQPNLALQYEILNHNLTVLQSGTALTGADMINSTLRWWDILLASPLYVGSGTRIKVTLKSPCSGLTPYILRRSTVTGNGTIELSSWRGTLDFCQLSTNTGTNWGTYFADDLNIRYLQSISITGSITDKFGGAVNRGTVLIYGTTLGSQIVYTSSTGTFSKTYPQDGDMYFATLTPYFWDFTFTPSNHYHRGTASGDKVFGSASPAWWSSAFVYRKRISFATNHSVLKPQLPIDVSLFTGYTTQIATNAFAWEGLHEWSHAFAHTNGTTFIVYLGMPTASSNNLLSVWILPRNHVNDSWGTPYYLGSTSSIDAHMYPSLAVDNNGYLHVVWGAHLSPLRYAKSALPYNHGSWTNIQAQIVGDCTYPHLALNSVTNNLHLIYRGAGTQGTIGIKSDLSLAVLPSGGSIWTQRGSFVHFGSSVDPAVMPGDFRCINGTLHVVWSWRGDYGGTLNDYYHAYHALSTDDGTAWKLANGSVQTLPMTQDISPRPFTGTYHLVHGVSVDNNGSICVLTNQWGPDIDDIADYGTYKLAQWDGANWQNFTIGAPARVLEGNLLISGDNTYYVFGGGHSSGIRRMTFYNSSSRGSSWTEQIIAGIPVYEHFRGILKKDFSFNALEGIWKSSQNIYYLALANFTKMRADGNDIRVVYNGTELDRVLWDSNFNPSTITYRLVDGIPANATQGTNTWYYIYYGNATAGTPAANWDNVFQFVERFEPPYSPNVMLGSNNGSWITSQGSAFWVFDHSHPGSNSIGQNSALIDDGAQSLYFTKGGSTGTTYFTNTITRSIGSYGNVDGWDGAEFSWWMGGNNSFSNHCLLEFQFSRGGGTTRLVYDITVGEAGGNQIYTFDNTTWTPRGSILNYVHYHNRAVVKSGGIDFTIPEFGTIATNVGAIIVADTIGIRGSAAGGSSNLFGYIDQILVRYWTSNMGSIYIGDEEFVAGGLNLTKDLTSSLNLSETNIRLLTTYRSSVGTVNLTPVEARVATFIKAVTDTEDLTSALSRGLISYRDLIGTVNLSSAEVPVRTIVQSITDTEQLSSAVGLVKTYIRSIADSEELSSVLGRLLNVYRSYTDTEQLSSAIQTAISFVKSYTDIENLSEALSATRVILVSHTDTENLTSTIVNVLARVKNIADTEQLTALEEKLYTGYRSFTETEQLGATVAVGGIVFTKSITDTEQLSSTEQPVSVKVVDSTATENLTEAITDIMSRVKSVAETVNLSDSLTKLYTGQRAITDTEQLSSAPSISVSFIKALTSTENLSSLEASVRAKIIALADTLNLSEAIVTALTVNVLTLGENLALLSVTIPLGFISKTALLALIWTLTGQVITSNSTLLELLQVPSDLYSDEDAEMPSYPVKNFAVMGVPASPQTVNFSSLGTSENGLTIPGTFSKPILTIANWHQDRAVFVPSLTTTSFQIARASAGTTTGTYLIDFIIQEAG